MVTRRRRLAALAALAVLAAALALAACGGGSSSTTSSSSASSSRAPAAPPDPLALPPGIPDRATGPAQAASRRVIAGWLRALRHGDVRRAAHYFALPSRYQNGTPVLVVHNEVERQAINAALPCGAVATAMGGSGPFTIVRFRLTERRGGNCGTGVGGSARGAIRVRRGKIVEWYRLPDVPGAQSPSAPAEPAV